MKTRLAVMLVALSLAAAACGQDAGPTASMVASTTTAPVESDPAAFCAALEGMFAAQPAGAFIGDEFGDAMNAYADAVQDAADLAPDEQASALGNLAEFVRDSAADPNAEGLADRAFALVGPMLQVQIHATEECGLDVEALAGDSDGPPPPPIRDDITELDGSTLAAINAYVPDDVDLEFESFITTDDEDYPVLAAAPVGWEARDFIGTSFEAGEDLGFFTQMDVGAHCDGICAPRDWGSLMVDAEFGPFSGLNDAISILRDEELNNPMGRLVVYREDTTITPVKIVATRWDDRADRYFRCEAKLDEDDVGLWETFAAACEAAVPLWIPIG